MNDKKELQVAALENGTVIDHIPSEKLFTVVSSTISPPKNCLPWCRCWAWNT